MAEKSLKVNQRVEVTGKDVQGVVAYVGSTLFSGGKWIGVVLDVPRGKNNGSVQGKSYFECKENHGMFVRQSQLTLLDGGPEMVRSSPGGSMASTPDENSRTRARLSSSRLSLVSSRSQGDFLGKEESMPSTPSADSAGMQPTSEPTSKRASFIETGFVETLKPQFIPGQAMVSPGASLGGGGTMEERLSTLQSQQEMDGLQSEIRDLNEKLDTLKAKRMQDKEKLKDFEKTRLQLDQMLEFKVRIMDSQASLQKDMQRAKQEAREAVEARDNHADEMADLAETVEMATLDKEMAEEKSETLQLELEQAREKIEEMTLDLEILRAEMSDRLGGDPGQVSSYEVKQLEQQNLRLRDTLVRMRDLSAHEKHEFQKLQKDLDQKKSEITELARTKEKLSIRVEELEHQIADLQEQVDASLGAEEMVQQLGDMKMTLEDRVKELEEEVTDLEAIHDMNENLLEGNRELEIELREEVDLANAATRTGLKEKEAALETVADREQTIGKFRELVQRLQEQSQDLQQQLERESSRPVSALPEILDFKKMFAETKANTKAVDLELRRIDVQQSNEHVQYLAAYMPDSFMSRGGDHDAVLVLLLLPRMLRKAEILQSQLRDKYPAVDKVDRAAVVKGHAVGQFAFKSRLAHHLHNLQMVLHQFLHNLNSCSPEVLLKVGAAYPEMSLQERAIDTFIELLRKDQLDENVPTEALEKCVAYLKVVLPAMFGPEARVNQTLLLADWGRSLSSACDSISTDVASFRALIKTGQEVGDMGLLCQHLTTATETVQQQLKQVRRRIPQDNAGTRLSFPEAVCEELLSCCSHGGSLARMMQEAVKLALQQLAVGGDTDAGVPQDKLKEFIAVAVDRAYGSDCDQSPVEMVKTSVGLIVGEVAKVTQAMQDGDYDVGLGTEEKVTAPITLRAQTIKKELEETKNLKTKLDTKEADIKELKITLKLKQEELSEMTIRKELSEKKLGTASKDHEINNEKLQRKLDDALQMLRRKEKEFEETMDHLQADIDSLENERGELKEKLKNYSKKIIFEGVSKTAGLVLSPSSASLSSPAVTVVAPLGSQALLEENKRLRTALRKAVVDVANMEFKLAVKQFQQLKPLEVPSKPGFGEKKKDNRLDELWKKSEAIKKEFLHKLATPTVVDITRKDKWKQYEANKNRFADLRRRAEELSAEVMEDTIRRTPGGQVASDFGVFPTREMAKALQETQPVRVATIQLPVDSSYRGPSVINLDVDHRTLKLIHSKIFP